MPSFKYRFGLVLPLANEEQTVEGMLLEILDQISREDKIFCVVDHVSTDSTRQIIESKFKKEKRVQLIWAPENKCVVDAYFRGYREALKQRCQYILEMDGGFSHQPKEIGAFFEAMQNGYDFAVGCRFMPGGKFSGPFLRYLVSRLGSALTRVLLKTEMLDMTSGFQCFTFDAMSLVVQKGVRSKAHFFQTEIKYQLRNSRWIEIPIVYKNPSSLIGFSTLKEAFVCLWQLYRS